MKKAIINYSKDIWFKLMNDRMSLGEAVSLLAIAIALSYIVIRVSHPSVTVVY